MLRRINTEGMTASLGMLGDISIDELNAYIASVGKKSNLKNI